MQLINTEQAATRQGITGRSELPRDRAVVITDQLCQLAGRVFSRASDEPQKVADRAVTGDIAAEDFARYAAAVVLRNIKAQGQRRRQMRDQRKPQPVRQLRRGSEGKLVGAV